MSKRVPWTKLFFLTLYALGMAYVEAMVVVYIRRLLGHADLSGVTVSEIAIILSESRIYFEEQTREAATIVMLIAVAVISGRGWRQRAGAFLWCFALWDIFYYVFLRLWLGWPSTLMDMDVLFLIPGPWVAPVLLPVAISVAMAGCGYYLLLGRPDAGESPT